MYIRFYALCILVFALCSGCMAQKVAVMEPVMFTSFEEFKLGPEGGVDLVWSTKRISDAETLKSTLQKYDSLILDQIWFVVDRKSSRLVDDRHVLEIARNMTRQIQVRFAQELKIVETPDHNTLCLDIAITNLETRSPILAAASRLLPAGAGSSSVSTIVTGEEVNVAAITVELLVSDAMINEPLLAAIDKGFDKEDIVTLLDAPDKKQEAISLWAGRLWRTLAYWNWIKTQSPAP